MYTCFSNITHASYKDTPKRPSLTSEQCLVFETFILWAHKIIKNGLESHFICKKIFKDTSYIN